MPLGRIAIKAYPNPFNDEINIGFNSVSNGRFEISLSSITGIRVFESSINISSQHGLFTIFPLSDSTLPSGVYFLTVRSSEGIQTQKLIKN